ncbi:MAG: YebO family protein [Gibbsiella quercinecans]|uniref:YebO family protein n=1 Tax=Gibbsiella quercinecans TaxID=929813 RepID=UPI003F3F0FA4
MFDLGVGPAGLVSLAVGILAVALGLWLWFLVNRASVRANEQIRLLQEIAEQQRQQTALLKRLVQDTAGEETASVDEAAPGLDFSGFVPER